MDGNETRKEGEPVVVIVERRSQRQRELTSEEVMTILRKRAAKAGKRPKEGN